MAVLTKEEEEQELVDAISNGFMFGIDYDWTQDSCREDAVEGALAYVRDETMSNVQAVLEKWRNSIAESAK